MTEPKFYVRPAKEADRADVVRLVSEMHGVDVTPRFEWLYLDNPHGIARSWIAVEATSGRTEAVTSVFPRRVIVDGEERLGSIGGDCYVAPAARRRGMATRLHEATREGMAAAGIEFMYGVPLAHNFGALVKAGAREVTAFERYVRPLRREFLTEDLPARLPWGARQLREGSIAQRIAWKAITARSGGRLKPDPAVDIAEAQGFGDEWNEWVTRVYPGRGVFCVRDSAYMNFRHRRDTQGALGTVYLVRVRRELCGMFVLHHSPPGATSTLVDLFTTMDRKSLRQVLRAAILTAYERGSTRLAFQATPHPVLAYALRAEGFWERPRDEHSKFQVLAPAATPDRQALDGVNSWFFMSADQDLG